MRIIAAKQRTPRSLGAAYTFMVLMASITLFTMGGSLAMPARNVLAMGSVRLHKLNADQLSRSGLEWALSEIAQNGPRALNKQFSLSTGKVDVTVSVEGEKITVRSRAEPNLKIREARPLLIKASVEKKNGGYQITSIKRLSVKKKAPPKDQNKDQKGDRKPQ